MGIYDGIKGIWKGRHTSITHMSKQKIPKVLIHWKTPQSTLRNLNIVSGLTGVGKDRVVKDLKRLPGKVLFTLTHPWRVRHDATSHMVLTAVFRENIVLDNNMDGGAKKTKDNYKRCGIHFWGFSFDTVVAENVLRNFNWGGVDFETMYRCPTGWNLTRDNTIENVYGLNKKRRGAYLGRKGPEHREFYHESFRLT